MYLVTDFLLEAGGFQPKIQAHCGFLLLSINSLSISNSSDASVWDKRSHYL